MSLVLETTTLEPMVVDGAKDGGKEMVATESPLRPVSEPAAPAKQAMASVETEMSCEDRIPALPVGQAIVPSAPMIQGR